MLEEMNNVLISIAIIIIAMYVYVLYKAMTEDLEVKRNILERIRRIHRRGG